MKLYKVLRGRSAYHGGKATYITGKWMPRRKVLPCKSGYHLTTLDNLHCWVNPDLTIWEAEGRGQKKRDYGNYGKICFAEARILRKVAYVTWAAWEQLFNAQHQMEGFYQEALIRLGYNKLLADLFEKHLRKLTAAWLAELERKEAKR